MHKVFVPWFDYVIKILSIKKICNLIVMWRKDAEASELNIILTKFGAYINDVMQTLTIFNHPTPPMSPTYTQALCFLSRNALPPSPLFFFFFFFVG